MGSRSLSSEDTKPGRLSPSVRTDPLWLRSSPTVALHWIRGLVALNLKLLSTIPVQSPCTGIVDFCIGNRDKAYAKLRPQFRYSNAPPSGPVNERVSGLLLMQRKSCAGILGFSIFLRN